MHLIHLADSNLDSFCDWLCQREHEIVGRPGMAFRPVTGGEALVLLASVEMALRFVSA